MRDLFQRFERLPSSVSAGRLRNIRSDLRKAMDLAGYGRMRKSYQAPLTTVWNALADTAGRETTFLRFCGFARFCAAKGIEPNGVTDAVMAAYRDALETDGLVGNPGRRVRNAIQGWNQVRSKHPHLALPLLTLPELPRRGWTIDLSRYPDSFQRDVDRRLSVLAGTNPLEEDAPPRPLRPATLKHRKFQIQMAAAALHHSGVAIAEITSLAVLVRIDNFRRLLTELMRRNAVRKGIDISAIHELQPTEAIHGIATTLKSIARHDVKLPESDLERLSKICKRLDPEIDGIREKNAKLLAQFDDPANQAKILHLAEQLFEEARQSRRKDRRTARLVRDAVALDFLVYANIRLENLITIRVDKHLTWIRELDGDKVILSFGKTETKNNRAQRHELVGETVEHLRVYLRDYWPLLGPESGRPPSSGPRHKLD